MHILHCGTTVKIYRTALHEADTSAEGNGFRTPQMERAVEHSVNDMDPSNGFHLGDIAFGGKTISFRNEDPEVKIELIEERVTNLPQTGKYAKLDAVPEELGDKPEELGDKEKSLYPPLFSAILKNCSNQGVSAETPTLNKKSNLTDLIE